MPENSKPRVAAASTEALAQGHAHCSGSQASKRIRIAWNSWKVQVARLHLGISDSVGLGGSPALALLLNSQVILVPLGSGSTPENWCSGRCFLSFIYLPLVLAQTLIVQSFHHCLLYCRHCLITRCASRGETDFLPRELTIGCW